MSEIKDQEAEVKACEACAEEAEKNAAAAAEETAAEATDAEATAPAADDAAKVAAKKKTAMIVRCVIWAIVLIGMLCFFIFKNSIMEYMRRGKLVEQITTDCKTELKITPFSVKYLGDNKYEVIFEDPAAVKEDMKKYNRVVYTYDAQKHELSRTEGDMAWTKRKNAYIHKNSQKPAEAPKK